MFAGYLGQQGLSHASIKVYLLAVHNLHISASLHEKFSRKLTPRLELVLKGIKKEKAKSAPLQVAYPSHLKQWAVYNQFLLSTQLITTLSSGQPAVLHSLASWGVKSSPFPPKMLTIPASTYRWPTLPKTTQQQYKLPSNIPKQTHSGRELTCIWERTFVQWVQSYFTQTGPPICVC